MQDQSARPTLALAGVADGSSLIPAFANSTAPVSPPRHRRIVRTRSAKSPSTSSVNWSQALGILGAELIEEIAKPQPPALLEATRSSSRLSWGEFGDRVDERAAAKILRRETPFQRIEGAEIWSSGDLSDGAP